MLRIIFKRNPLLVLIGGFVSRLGSMMQSFALSLYVLDTTGSGAKFASVLTMTMIPRLILGPLAGILSDRVSRKKTMVFLDIASGIITLSFAVYLTLTSSTSLIPIYIYVFTLTTISVFFEPSSMAIIPDIVTKEELPAFNSAMQFLSFFAGFFHRLLQVYCTVLLVF